LKETIKKYFRVDRSKIHLLRSILEGYNGMAVLRTVDSRQGLVVLYIAPGCEEEIGKILVGLREEIRIEAAPVVERGDI